MKNFNIWTFTEKSEEGFHKKLIKRRDCLKKGLGQFTDLKGGLSRKGVVSIEWGLIP